jgi:hypothetical protein
MTSHVINTFSGSRSLGETKWCVYWLRRSDSEWVHAFHCRNNTFRGFFRLFGVSDSIYTNNAPQNTGTAITQNMMYHLTLVASTPPSLFLFLWYKQAHLASWAGPYISVANVSESGNSHVVLSSWSNEKGVGGISNTGIVRTREIDALDSVDSLEGKNWKMKWKVIND